MSWETFCRALWHCVRNARFSPSLVERIEQRAYAMLSPKEQAASSYASVDPFADLSPEDSELWIIVLKG